MSRVTELDRDKKNAIRAALELEYTTKYIEGILNSTSSAQVNQWMIAARKSDEYESPESVKQHLKMKGIRLPRLETMLGQNFVD